MPSPNNFLRGLPGNMLTALFHPWTWRMAWRDSRTQRLRLVIFSLAIVSGISALVAIHSLKASVQAGIATQTKDLLGSDLQISSKQPFSASDFAKLTPLAEQISRETTFPSMVKFLPGGGARLMQLRGIEGGYPFYGPMETRPADVRQRLPKEPGILVEQTILDQYGSKVGDEVELGSLRLKILGVVEKAAPRSSRFSGFAPEAYMRLSDMQRSGLLDTNSLASYQLHFYKLRDGIPAKMMESHIRNHFKDTSWSIDTPEERQENLGKALDYFQQFLGILAMASLALGAIGVAGAVHAHISRRVLTVAILRCLGCPGHMASAVYFAQAGAIGMLGAVMGAGLGIALQMGVLVFFKDSIPVSISPSPEWKIVAQTTAAGFAVCCGFALIPLLKIRRIPPAATLRGGASLSGGHLLAIPVYLMVAGLLAWVALSNDPNWMRALGLLGGLAVAFAILAIVARGLMAVTKRIVRPSWPYLLRQGMSNIHRPSNQTLLFLLSLGLGTFLLVTILLAGNLLNQRLNLGETGISPNLYLVDVQPDQEAGVKALITKQNLPVLESSPMVTMRIQAIRGVPVSEVKGVPRWVLRREFRSTYRASMNSTEKLTAGKWESSITDSNAPVPLSLEEKIAADLKVGVGDEITLDVQGVPVNAHITSLREVDWSRFNLNFFMVFPPGVLEGAPGFHVMTTRTPTPAASGELQRQLVQDFPNVSAIDLTQILGKVREILGKISLVVSVLAGFTVLAGLPILIGTLLNGRDVRLRESVLLRTLGASATQVRTILTIEYATLGLLSALTGVLLASAGNAALALTIFETSPLPSFSLLATAFTTAAGISVLGGLALSRGVCNHPPLEILRGGV